MTAGRRIARCVAVLLLVAWLPGAPPARAEAVERVPGSELEKRVAARVQMQRYALKEQGLGHYGLVFSIQPRELRAFMRLIVLRGSGDEIVPGAVSGPELHGGAVLAFLLEHWRPDGRPARLGDAFAFSSPRQELPLRELYRAHQHQVFVPSGAEQGRPGLPRMLYRLPAANGGAESAEVDSYKFLGTLVAQEADYSRTWTNRRGQTLSTERLLRRAWDHYLAERSPDAEVADHGNLHLVALLLAFNRGRSAMPAPTTPPLDSNRLKERFLAVELARDDFDGEEGSISLVHYVESLGQLLQDPQVRWTRAERTQVREWLAELESTRLQPLETLPAYQLAHLLRGLRWVNEQREKLAD